MAACRAGLALVGTPHHAERLPETVGDAPASSQESAAVSRIKYTGVDIRRQAHADPDPGDCRRSGEYVSDPFPRTYYPNVKRLAVFISVFSALGYSNDRPTGPSESGLDAWLLAI